MTMKFEAPEGGTLCKECRCYLAAIVIDGEPICAACDDGDHSPILSTTLTKAPAPAPIALPATAKPERPARPAGQPVERKKMVQLTPVQLQQIQEARDCEGAPSIAERIGASAKAVEYHLTKFRKARKLDAIANGIADAQKVATQAPRLQAPLEPELAEPVPHDAEEFPTVHPVSIDGAKYVPAAEVSALIDGDRHLREDQAHDAQKIESVLERELAEAKAGRPHLTEGCVTVSITLCAASIDRWWASLNLDEKAEILAAHFDCCQSRIGIEGGTR